MGQWDLQENETSLYFENTVNDKVIDKVQEVLESDKDTIYVSFNVTGRTFHQLLSYQLAERLISLYGPKVNVKIGYNYECVITKVTDEETKVTLIRFKQRMYGDYHCSCGCGQELTGTCYGVGEESDDEGYRWRMFTENCWQKVAEKTDEEIWLTYKEAQ